MSALFTAPFGFRTHKAGNGKEPSFDAGSPSLLPSAPP